MIALEHDVEYAEKTTAMLAKHGLSELAEVRHAPITEVQLSGQSLPWYDPTACKDLFEIGVALIDGPPKAVGRQVRYPAIPILRDQLVAGAVVLVDDVEREDEQAIVHRWLAEWPELTSERLPCEKGAVRLLAPQPR